jgi:serine/threonine protein kinase
MCEGTQDLALTNTSTLMNLGSSHQVTLDPVGDSEGSMRYTITGGSSSEHALQNTWQFGIVWKVEFQNGSEVYVSQHLPLLDHSVTPRTDRGAPQQYKYISLPIIHGSNSYRLYYSLVGPQGGGSHFVLLNTSNASLFDCESNGFCVQPPENMTIDLELRSTENPNIRGVELWSLIQAEYSPDHNLIQNYCIKTFGCIPEEPNFGGVVCQWRMISTSSEVDFTAKNGSLSLAAVLIEDNGRSESNFIAVYATSHGNCMLGGDVPRYASWLHIRPVACSRGIIATYSPTIDQFPNTRTGLDHFRATFNVTNTEHLVAYMPYILYAMVKHTVRLSECKDETIIGNYNISSQCSKYSIDWAYLNGECCALDHGGFPPGEAYHFIVYFEPLNSRLANHLGKRYTFNVEARSPTPVRNLSAKAVLLLGDGALQVNLSWLEPLELNGAEMYFVVIFDQNFQWTRNISVVPTNEMNVTWSEVLPLGNNEPQSLYTVQVSVGSQWGRSDDVERNITVNGTTATQPSDPIDQVTLALIIAIPTALLLLIPVCVAMVLSYLCALRHMKKPQLIELDVEVKSNTFELLEGDLWEMSPSYIVLSESIGEGQFGEVFKATICGGGGDDLQDDSILPQIAAVKILSNECEEEKEGFLKEIKTMKLVTTTDCPHVVKMVGCCTLQEPYALILEYMRYGDLLEFLRYTRDRLKCEWLQSTSNGQYQETPNHEDKVGESMYEGLEWCSPTHALRMMHHIATGMKCLSDLGVIHRDLACRNILLGENMEVKISDFGLSRENGVYIKTTTGKLPLRWMAIESITERLFTTKSDVWSYGVVMWEIATLGCRPYSNVSNRSVLPTLMEGYRMEKPANCSDELYHIMLNCWKADRSMRPTFLEIEEKIGEILASGGETHLEGKLSTYEEEILSSPSSRTASSSSNGSYIGLSMTRDENFSSSTDHLMLEIVKEEDEEAI